MKIGGTASVFYRDGNPGTEYQLFDNVFERIDPQAFAGVLQQDVLGLWNHDLNQILGRTPNTLRIWTDGDGLQYEISLPSTTLGKDIFKLVERGDIRGSSFGALVPKHRDYVRWSKADDGRDIRTIRKVSRLIDVSPVTIPAFQATTVSLRSAEVDALKVEREHYLRSQEFLARIKNLS